MSELEDDQTVSTALAAAHRGRVFRGITASDPEEALRKASVLELRKNHIFVESAVDDVATTVAQHSFDYARHTGRFASG